MLIWGLLAVFVVLGCALLCVGRLPISAKRQLVGANARLLGGVLLAVPPVLLAVVLLSVRLLIWSGRSAEAAATQAQMIGWVSLSVITVAIAANLKRLSVPIEVAGDGPDFSQLGATTKEPRFEFLEDTSSEESG